MKNSLFSILLLSFLIFFQSETARATFSSSTYYLYEFGNNDYYSKQVGGDGTWTGEVQLIFDGAGNFSAQGLADSESANDTFNGTYSVANGVLNLTVGGDTMPFRITPDGETLANVTAIQSEGAGIDNEALRILIKESKIISNSFWNLMLPAILGGDR